MPLTIYDGIADRALGCILAGAIGDAMGAPFEGRTGPLEFREHDRWSISDDTQLTLATCESITELGVVSPEHIAGRFAVWYRERRITGLGSSTLKALRDLEAGVHWALAGARGEMSAGNGTAMRIAPLAFFLDPAVPKDRQIIRDVCRITHHNEEAYVGALALLAAIRFVSFMPALHLESLLLDVSELLPDSRVRDRIVELDQLPAKVSVAQVATRYGSSGYVVESVPLALYAAKLSEGLDFKAVLRGAIEAGGDTDTVASMTGQIMGARIGAAQIPRDLLDSLPENAEIFPIAEAFANSLGAEFSPST